MTAVTYLDAISQAIREEMRRDEAVFLLGEDVGTYGGAFKVSAGFQQEFGSERVMKCTDSHVVSGMGALCSGGFW